MKPKELKLFNGGDWESQGGHLYVAAFSVIDAARLVVRAEIKIKGLNIDPLDKLLVGRVARDIKVYFAKNCWGNPMDGITPERGVWWAKAIPGGWAGKPERIL